VSRALRERTALLDDLNRAGRQLSAATIMFHQAVADRLGLNPTDHKCVDLLSQAGPRTAGELADMTGLTTGAITGVIDRLEKAGFVRREDDPNDRRRVIVRVIPKRSHEMARLFEHLSAAVAELSARYSDRELATILDFMARSQQVLHDSTLKLREPPAPARRRSPKGARTRQRAGKTNTQRRSENAS
jgi:DNA-binding MarR family transcriptional regulator